MTGESVCVATRTLARRRGRVEPDLLPAHPVLSVATGVAAKRRTKPAVSHAIDQMEAAGILTRLTESSRNRAWEASGLLELIAGLEAAQPL